MGKFRHFLGEHFKDIIIVALFTVAVFAVGKLFNGCIFPPVEKVKTTKSDHGVPI